MKNRSTNFKRAMCWKYALKRQDRNPNYFDNLHQYSKNRKDKYGPQEKTNNSTSNLTCRDRRKYEEIDCFFADAGVARVRKQYGTDTERSGCGASCEDGSL